MSYEWGVTVFYDCDDKFCCQPTHIIYLFEPQYPRVTIINDNIICNNSNTSTWYKSNYNYNNIVRPFQISFQVFIKTLKTECEGGMGL